MAVGAVGSLAPLPLPDGDMPTSDPLRNDSVKTAATPGAPAQSGIAEDTAPVAAASAGAAECEASPMDAEGVRSAEEKATLVAPAPAATAAIASGKKADGTITPKTKAEVVAHLLELLKETKTREKVADMSPPTAATVAPPLA